MHTAETKYNYDLYPYLNLFGKGEPQPITNARLAQDEAFDLLREAIIVRAVIDAREVLKGKKIPGVSLYDLERFFTGSWGQELLGRIDGKTLFRQLLSEGVCDEQT